MSSAAKSSIRLCLLLCSLSVSLASCAPRLIITESRDLSVNTGDMSMTVEPGSDLETMDSSIGQYDFGMRLFDITVTKSSYRMNSGVEFLSDKRVAAFLAAGLRKKYFG